MNENKPDTTATDSEIPYYELDGKTHLNTHFLQAKKEIGKMLAHYSVYRFKHPYFGPFKSMEGFVCYLRGGCNDDRFRSLNGHRSKEHMKAMMAQGVKFKTAKQIPDYNHIVLLANYAKISQNLVIRDTLINTDLPFDHYFLFGDGNVIIRPQESEDLIKMYEELRKMFKENIVPEPYDYSKVPVVKKIPHIQ